MPAADLGIRRGVRLAYGLKSLPTPELVYKTALRGSHTEALLLFTYEMQ